MKSRFQENLDCFNDNVNIHTKITYSEASACTHRHQNQNIFTIYDNENIKYPIDMQNDHWLKDLF